jgi:hypothetical protein
MAKWLYAAGLINMHVCLACDCCAVLGFPGSTDVSWLLGMAHGRVHLGNRALHNAPCFPDAGLRVS